MIKDIKIKFNFENFNPGASMEINEQASRRELEIYQFKEKHNLSKERYLKALERQKNRIVNGVKLTMIDSNTAGDKFTSVSWGLCSNEKEAWPDPEDHKWPDQFIKFGRVAPKDRDNPNGTPQRCPFDYLSKNQNQANILGSWGCFYRCLFFQNKKENRPSREEAINLYSSMIQNVK